MTDIDEDSVAWVEQLVRGDDAVVQEFWQRYGSRLQRFAEVRMAPRLQQRVGPDDVVQSVCRTFVRRTRKGELRLSGSESLWRLLCAITLTKVRQHARFHYRQKRSVRRELAQSEQSPEEATPFAEQLMGNEPTAEEVVAFAEQMEQLLNALDEDERLLVQLRLEGLRQDEIANRMGCSERTVRRLLSRVRSRWKTLLEDSLAAGS